MLQALAFCFRGCAGACFREIALGNLENTKKELQVDRDLRLEEMKAHKFTQERLEEAIQKKVPCFMIVLPGTPPRNARLAALERPE